MQEETYNNHMTYECKNNWSLLTTTTTTTTMEQPTHHPHWTHVLLENPVSSSTSVHFVGLSSSSWVVRSTTYISGDSNSTQSSEKVSNNHPWQRDESTLFSPLETKGFTAWVSKTGTTTSLSEEMTSPVQKVTP